MELNQIEKKRQLELKNKKPIAYRKIVKLKENCQNNIPTPLIDIAFNYKCNMHCKHCMITKVTTHHHTLSVADLKNFTDQADALGICQLALSGGEPLYFDNLDAIAEALQPEKFHLKMSTNGTLLDSSMARKLSLLGFDKISISIDEFHPGHSSSDLETYPQIKALRYVLDNGMTPVMTTVVTHKNCQDGHLEKLALFATKEQFKLDIYIAKPIGEWQGRFDLLINQEDYIYLERLHTNYPVLCLDTFPAYGINRGCCAVQGSLHLSPYGDIFPCGFIHLAIGNIYEEPLKDILARGMRIKYFASHSPVCLGGRNIPFLKKIAPKPEHGCYPPRWDQVFGPDDFLPE